MQLLELRAIFSRPKAQIPSFLSCWDRFTFRIVFGNVINIIVIFIQYITTREKDLSVNVEPPNMGNFVVNLIHKNIMKQYWILSFT